MKQEEESMCVIQMWIQFTSRMLKKGEIEEYWNGEFIFNSLSGDQCLWNEKHGEIAFSK